MNYDPKLKKVMEQIKLILKANNVGASIVLHRPGFSEFYLHVNPDYSCITMENQGLRIRAKASDFGGDKKKRNQVIEDSVSLIQHLADTSGSTSLMMYNVLDQLKKVMDIDSSDGNMTDHTTQNN